MKLQALLLTFLLALAPVKALAGADAVYLPSLLKNATGTDLGGGHYGLDVAATFTEGGLAADGTPKPAQSKVVAGSDGTNAYTLRTDTLGQLQVNVIGSVLPTGAATSALQTTGNTSLGLIDTSTAATATSTASIDTKTPALVSGRVPVDGSGVTQPVSVSSLPLPTGAATEATLSTLDGKVVAVDTGNVTVVGSALPTGAATEATLSSLNGKTIDTSNVTVTTSALPTGAATSALQTTGNTSLSTLVTTAATLATEVTASAINAKLANDFGANAGAVRTAAQMGNATGTADFGSGTTSSQTLRVVLPTDQAPVQVKAPVNSTGSGASGTVSTVTTLTAPANATGFILQCLDSSDANIRWAVGRAASTTVGQQLQPGRDSGYVPVGANVSIIAESGTQNYDIQWVSQ